MYMQQEFSAVGGESMSSAFELLEGESDWGTGMAKQPEAAIKLKAERERKYMVVMKGVSAVGKVVCY
jgi:hypothetical protein